MQTSIIDLPKAEPGNNIGRLHSPPALTTQLTQLRGPLLNLLCPDISLPLTYNSQQSRTKLFPIYQIRSHVVIIVNNATAAFFAVPIGADSKVFNPRGVVEGVVPHGKDNLGNAGPV